MVKRVLLLLMLCALLAAACGEDGETEAEQSPSQLTGVIVEIDSDSIEDVNSFVLRAEGQEYTIYIDETVDYGMPMGHLNEHRAGALPVLVDLESRDGKLYALSILDAPETEATPAAT